MIHYFKQSLKDIPIPNQFTYPFNYTPHPLCIIAAKETMEHIKGMKNCVDELAGGKMFGVLVCKDHDGRLCYLSAFSGLLMGKNKINFFVPPVFDLLNKEGYFQKEERNISLINRQIEKLSNQKRLSDLNNEYTKLVEKKNNTIKKAKEEYKASKAMRELLRKDINLSKEENNRLIKESQFQKAEIKRIEKDAANKIATIKESIDIIYKEIDNLKIERKKRSANLQKYLFSKFSFLNILGERKDLNEIFIESFNIIPPSGSGECAGPKLLQYAFINNLFPIAMAEFWWGNSPKGTIRHHGQYYPACTGKCKPILSHMLKGLDIEKNPLSISQKYDKLNIAYEDDYLLAIDKPAGLLSVPGKENEQSVKSVIKASLPRIKDIYVVHRLDMATSGILIIAKNISIYKEMQRLFATKQIKKRYIAVVNGIVKENGIISLKLRPDYLNRPRQIVDNENGKEAITSYNILGYEDKNGKQVTRLELFPSTGRTHQLRVHCAHSLGLNAPIIGDELYGNKAERLYLHAEMIEFNHPITKNKIIIEVKEPF